jgi:hypothetical protein
MASQVMIPEVLWFGLADEEIVSTGGRERVMGRIERINKEASSIRKARHVVPQSQLGFLFGLFWFR